MELKYTKNNDNSYSTIRDVLKKEFKISNNLITKLKAHESILLNGKFTYLDKNIEYGDVVSVLFDYDEENEIVPIKQNLIILYEDEWLLIISKPPGIPVHPSMGHYSDSLSNGVSYYFNKIGLHKKIRVVNRLDLGTSGIVIYAKTEYIQEALKKQKDHSIFKKEYLAILEGHLDKSKGTIDAPISRKENSIIERKIDFDNGLKAVSHYELIENFVEPKTKTKLALVKYELETRKNSPIETSLSLH